MLQTLPNTGVSPKPVPRDSAQNGGSPKACVVEEFILLLTKLEVGVIGANVITSTEDPFHNQSNTHGIEEAKMLGDPIVLKGGRKSNNREQTLCSASISIYLTI